MVDLIQMLLFIIQKKKKVIPDSWKKAHTTSTFKKGMEEDSKRSISSHFNFSPWEEHVSCSLGILFQTGEEGQEGNWE